MGGRMSRCAVLILPLPPSINYYWRANGNRRFICEAGKRFRGDVWAIAKSAKIESFGTKRLFMTVTLHFRDKRKSDIDNRIKALWDALQHAGIYEDDEQIDILLATRGEIKKGGQCVVQIQESHELQVI
jgi:crossover junction endodeoxyribonuclease RusA